VLRKIQGQLLPAIFFLATGAPSNVAATALSGVTKIAAGFSATCAIVTGGAVKCWGSWPESGGATTRFVPGDVTGLSSGVVDISVGTSHACAVTAGGGAKCWGSNGFGQLGNGGTSDTPTVTPVDVVGLTSGVASIAAGSNHTCAVTTAGAVKCWGYRGSGILGDGDFAGTSATPVDVVGLGNGSTTRIWAGTWHTCALTSSGGLKCWGDGFAATLGTSTVAGPGLVPADVVGLSSGVLAADAGPSLTFAVTAGGGVKYWGSVFGLPHSNTPFDVPGLASGIVNVAVGDLQPAHWSPAVA
jgi:alpha-tubulin suppressor-like RCC1 family protein